jgi:hypothetical protein
VLLALVPSAVISRMTGRIAVCIASLACALAALAVGTGVASAAETRSCGKQSVRSYHSIRVHGMTCRKAVSRLKDWTSDGNDFPNEPFDRWFCDMSGDRKLCLRGNGNAPYFTFLKRRRHHR